MTYKCIDMHLYTHIYIYIYIHSPATLLGTPVQLLGNTNCKSANHMAATHAFKHLDVVKMTGVMKRGFK